MYRGCGVVKSTMEVEVMSLAGGLLFMIWCSIVFFSIGAWAFWTITKQDKSIYQDWDDMDDDTFQDGVG